MIVLTPAVAAAQLAKKGICSAEIETPRAEEGRRQRNGEGKLACLVLLPITPFAANKVDDDGGEMGVLC